MLLFIFLLEFHSWNRGSQNEVESVYSLTIPVQGSLASTDPLKIPQTLAHTRVHAKERLKKLSGATIGQCSKGDQQFLCERGDALCFGRNV